MSTATAPTALPAGTWQLDAVHSTAGFAIRHAVVNTFRSAFKDVAATLTVNDDGTTSLTGVVQVDSIDLDDPNFKGHLMADDFFDAANHPTITFRSDSLKKDGGDIVIAGDLTIRGKTLRVEGRGEIADGVDDMYGNSRLGVSVETRIDRTAFGLNWNAPLPKGGFALANEVKLTLDLAFVKA